MSYRMRKVTLYHYVLTLLIGSDFDENEESLDLPADNTGATDYN